MAPPSSLSKLKVQLKLSISRLRMVQQKDIALAKQSRRAMAQLLEQGKLESARIRIENIIRSDITTELHEILELYCELLLARSQLLDPPANASPSLRPSSSSSSSTCDPGLEEAVRSLVYAAPRTEVKELHAARALLVDKFGKDFALSAMEGTGVAERVLKKLRVETPSDELVDAYMREIARAYGVSIPGFDEDEDEAQNGADDDDNNDDEPSDGHKHKVLEAPLETEDLAKATPPKKLGPASPLRVAPPSPSSENVAPKVKLPGPPELKRAPSGGASRAAKKLEEAGDEARKSKQADDGPGGKIPDVDELARRFAALKR
ncbi:increased sodium tolerance protein-like protein 1 [Phyllosticta citrichinensis]|uniref:Increased sodium tolerance protein-like protein 1 n=1 Tax=Phyllosticta citrichinensis TaxID=1130410 RepID=A0ABR1XG80_9PEZI